MFKLLIVAALAVCVLGAPSLKKTSAYQLPNAESCDTEKCVLPDCRCSDTDIPGGLEPAEIPQLVYFTFDDAVTISNVDYYNQAFDDKVNPDGCPVQATFFASHEYTDYTKVHELHAKGHEIALHSITHQSSTDYWRGLSTEDLVQEFGGDLELMSHFANIDAASIKGMRLPLLQLAGNNTFEALKEIGLTYDCSWPTLKYLDPALWPYTLDYSSTQDCAVGPCPTAALPGVWVSPMVDWLDENDVVCSMVDGCLNVTQSVDGYFNFMVDNFNRHYKGNRAPFGFYVHAAWFGGSEYRFEAYLKFVDYLQEIKDVYLVSVGRGLDWVRNPVKLGEKLWENCQATYKPDCKPLVCKLQKESNSQTYEERYMTSCATTCPAKYPWLGNPLGKK